MLLVTYKIKSSEEKESFFKFVSSTLQRVTETIIKKDESLNILKTNINLPELGLFLLEYGQSSTERSIKVCEFLSVLFEKLDNENKQLLFFGVETKNDKTTIHNLIDFMLHLMGQHDDITRNEHKIFCNNLINFIAKIDNETTDPFKKLALKNKIFGANSEKDLNVILRAAQFLQADIFIELLKIMGDQTRLLKNEYTEKNVIDILVSTIVPLLEEKHLGQQSTARYTEAAQNIYMAIPNIEGFRSEFSSERTKLVNSIVSLFCIYRLTIDEEATFFKTYNGEAQLLRMIALLCIGDDKQAHQDYSKAFNIMKNRTTILKSNLPVFNRAKEISEKYQAQNVTTSPQP